MSFNQTMQFLRTGYESGGGTEDPAYLGARRRTALRAGQSRVSRARRLAAPQPRPRVPCASLPAWCANTGALYVDKAGNCWCREPGGQGWLCAESGGSC